MSKSFQATSKAPVSAPGQRGAIARRPSELIARPSVHAGSNGPSAALDADTGPEVPFGRGIDFRNIRIHADGSAAAPRGLEEGAPLAMGASHDPLEREAESIADGVLGTPNTAQPQRVSEPSTGNGRSLRTMVDAALREPGQPLDRSTRELFGFYWVPTSPLSACTPTPLQRARLRPWMPALYTVGRHIVLERTPPRRRPTTDGTCSPTS